MVPESEAQISRQRTNLLEEAAACEHLARLTHFRPEREALLRRAEMFRREADGLEISSAPSHALERPSWACLAEVRPAFQGRAMRAGVSSSV
ncbi:hypothetical protein SAMN02745194_01799 [Roseomonas rosea]|uniref:Uncharacterized protein n=2 Tax=Muricoccus roseus TaxID=198092 RepID=A0A1M6GTN9_9PROT|nr:hypothetical protein SAMN02745194_01799 [Roseomonas rosea]